MTAPSPLVQPEQRVLVIGAGPAGLSAAVTAAEHGLPVLLVDEAALPGGQYLAGAARPGEFQAPAEREGARLIARLDELSRAGRVEVWCEATVWHLGPDLTAGVFRRAAGGKPRVERVRAAAVIIAAGARETVAPFPGWTLPGVMTAGAAQLLAKRHGILPFPDLRGRRVLLAGSGLLLLPAAARLAGLGAHVTGVLETVRPAVSLLRRAGGLSGLADLAPALWARRGETWHYLSEMRRHRIPWLFARAVVRARASSAGLLEAVYVTRLDDAGEPVPGSVETLPVELLCMGYGLVPNVELAQLAGARMIYDASLGGWAVATDEQARVCTSVTGLFAAGETAGVSGAAAALLSGRIAAMSAAEHLGRLPRAALDAELAGTDRRRRNEARFGATMNLLSGAPDALYRSIPDETPVCRCEEVTAGQVREAIAAGVHSLDGLKAALHIGQGLCQGRTCGPIVARIMAASTGAVPAAAGLYRSRPPVRPVPLAAIAGLLPVEHPEMPVLAEGHS